MAAAHASRTGHRRSPGAGHALDAVIRSPGHRPVLVELIERVAARLDA